MRAKPARTSASAARLPPPGSMLPLRSWQGHFPSESGIGLGGDFGCQAVDRQPQPKNSSSFHAVICRDGSSVSRKNTATDGQSEPCSDSSILRSTKELFEYAQLIAWLEPLTSISDFHHCFG